MADPLPAFDKNALEATEETALAALASAGAHALELIDAWVRAGNAAAVHKVAEQGAGPVRKAARRGLNVLASRGIKAEAPPRVASFATSEREIEAWLVAPDASGAVLIVIASRSPTSRAESGFFYLHDEGGIQGANVGELSGGRLKEALKRAAEAGPEPVRVPIEYARKRVAEARRILKALGAPEPLGMTSAKDLLEPVPSGEVAHPLDAEGLELADEDAKELAQNSGALHALPEFRMWMPDRSGVEEMLEDVGKHLTPESEPDPEQVKRVLTEAVASATDRYFSPERRARLALRLKDSALSVLATRGEVRALEVVATMKRIETAGLITDPPHEIAFLRAFFEKAIAALAARGQGRLQVPRALDPNAALETAP